jgi:hypothetical protein
MIIKKISLLFLSVEYNVSKQLFLIKHIDKLQTILICFLFPKNFFVQWLRRYIVHQGGVAVRRRAVSAAAFCPAIKGDRINTWPLLFKEIYYPLISYASFQDKTLAVKWVRRKMGVLANENQLEQNVKVAQINL